MILCFFLIVITFKINKKISSVGGVMVSIDAFQALDPGSIPGHRRSFSNFTSFQILLYDFNFAHDHVPNTVDTLRQCAHAFLAL